MRSTNAQQGVMPEKPKPSPNRIIKEGSYPSSTKPINVQQGELNDRPNNELMIGCSYGVSRWIQVSYSVDEYLTDFMIAFIDRPRDFLGRIWIAFKLVVGLSNDVYYSDVCIHSDKLRELQRFIDIYLEKRGMFADQLRSKRQRQGRGSQPVNQKGLYRKYIITKTDGHPVEPKAKYFVLRIDKDACARAAASRYARCVRRKNPKFASDIDQWVVANTKKDLG